MNRDDIEELIQQERKAFEDSKYEGKIPSWMIAAFKRAVMANPASAHKMPDVLLIRLMEITKAQMKIIDIRAIINLLYNTPFDKMFKDEEDAKLKYPELVNIINDVSYISKVREGELAIAKKKMFEKEGIGQPTKILKVT